MITRYGMDENFDMVAMETVSNQYLGGDTSLACSAETQTQIDQQVVKLVKTQHGKARQILMENRKNWMNWRSSCTKKKPLPGMNSWRFSIHNKKIFMDDIIRQRKELGVYIYIYTGGEPMVRKKPDPSLREA